MLHEKHPCQDPIERKVLKVELLHNSSIIDEAEALNPARFLGTESLVTVVYSRNEVEAARKYDIHTQAKEYFGVKIPSSVTHIEYGAFEGCTSLASITFLSVCHSHWDQGL